jgi:hypothetical protein
MPTVAFEADRPLTHEVMILGTLPYMAPEQIEGRDTSPRTYRIEGQRRFRILPAR